jgi:hypothetical protein
MEDNEYIVRESKVISVDDEYGGNRIKVRLGGLDANKTDDELPYCFPLLPNLIHIRPKVGEAVFVLLEKSGSPTGNRLYIGPILSQPYFYNQEMYDLTAFNMLLNRKTAPQQNPDCEPLNEGTLPDKEDIALIGRENTDIVLKENELKLRCGYKANPNGPIKQRLYFNKIDPAYIQLKYKKIVDNNNKEINSFVNIVADRINLLSRDSKTFFNLTDQKELITDETMEKILDEAHPLVYGDELISFLKQLVEVFRTHTHPFSMVAPSFTKNDKTVLEKNLDTMLSNAVRIN